MKRLAPALMPALTRLRDEVGRQELMIFGGIALLVIGVSKWSVPAAYMVAGGALLLVGLLGTFFSKRAG